MQLVFYQAFGGGYGVMNQNQRLFKEIVFTVYEKEPAGFI